MAAAPSTNLDFGCVNKVEPTRLRRFPKKSTQSSFSGRPARNRPTSFSNISSRNSRKINSKSYVSAALTASSTCAVNVIVVASRLGRTNVHGCWSLNASHLLKACEPSLL